MYFCWCLAVPSWLKACFLRMRTGVAELRWRVCVCVCVSTFWFLCIGDRAQAQAERELKWKPVQTVQRILVWCGCIAGCAKPAIGRCRMCQQPLCEADMDERAAGVATCEQAHGPHVALVVRQPWAQLIVAGTKTWELRGRFNTETGTHSDCCGWNWYVAG